MTGTVHPDGSSAPVEVAIVGSGFGGLCVALRLLRAGERRFVILEKGAEIGGTWRDNSYPGAACDVQSHLYSLSFEGKPDWSRRYAAWDEIQRYLLDVVERRGLRAHVRFGRTVNSAAFDAATGCWRIGTAEGETVVARHFVLGTGPLHEPHVPHLPGLGRFRGKIFHSARWDHAYDLRGKRVASIGTGASAVQYCPAIAPLVARLHVYQRTPGWVVPRDERAYPPRAQRRFARRPWLRRLHRARLYWQNEARHVAAVRPWLARAVGRLALLHLRRQVPDPALRRRLTPSITFGCKRVMISNDWYPMFLRPNVELVTAGIREIRPHSIVGDDGVEREMDCIVLGTGFVVDPRDYLRGFPIEGLPGHSIAADWRDGASAYRGISVAGFPNLHLLLGPNTGLGHNSVVFMLECQAHYVLECLRTLRERGADWLDVRPEAQREADARTQRALAGSVWNSGCASWYLQEDGRNFTIWPWPTWRYWLETRRVPADDYRFGHAGGAGEGVAARGGSARDERA